MKHDEFWDLQIGYSLLSSGVHAIVSLVALVHFSQDWPIICKFMTSGVYIVVTLGSLE